MAKVPNGVKTLPKISIAEQGARTLQTDDRQTDRRTDGRTNDNTTYIEKLLKRHNLRGGRELLCGRRLHSEQAPTD